MNALFPIERTTGPQVFNKHLRNAPENAVYIGRGSPWGNPYVVGQDGDRRLVITLYAEYLENNPKLKERVKNELKGRDLLCFCKPQACHGDVLLEVANTNN